MNENTCLYCNEAILEGRMICPLCESRLSDPDFLKIMRNESTSKNTAAKPKRIFVPFQVLFRRKHTAV